MEKLENEEIEQLPDSNEFARKTEAHFHDKIRGKKEKADHKRQSKIDEAYSTNMKVYWKGVCPELRFWYLFSGPEIRNKRFL